MFIGNAFRSIYDKFYIMWRRRIENEKFKDPQRREISDSVILTKKQMDEIDKFYLENYGQKIPYVWHKNFTAHSGTYDVQYFPELLYIPEFEHFMNFMTAYTDAFGDKNILPILAEKIGLKMPKTIISSVFGIIRDENYNIIAKEQIGEKLEKFGTVFAKPSVDSCSGQGCCLLNIKNDTDIYSKKRSADLLQCLGDNYLIQEKINCHESISSIYSGSVNTFRVITYIWKGEIQFMPSIMRIGQGGSFLDNAHAGGMFIAIDSDGTLHKNAMTEFNIQYTEHPDTHFVFEGAKIDLFPNVLDCAKKMHSLIPQIGVVNWDFTIDEYGDPVLIEANLKNGSVWLPQMAHGCSPFGERTAEVLRWLKFMKSIPLAERKKFCFGKTKD